MSVRGKIFDCLQSLDHFADDLRLAGAQLLNAQVAPQGIVPVQYAYLVPHIRNFGVTVQAIAVGIDEFVAWMRDLVEKTGDPDQLRVASDSYSELATAVEDIASKLVLGKIPTTDDVATWSDPPLSSEYVRKVDGRDDALRRASVGMSNVSGGLQQLAGDIDAFLVAAAITVAGLVVSAAGLVGLIVSCATMAVPVAIVAAIGEGIAWAVALAGVVATIVTWSTVVLDAGSNLTTPKIEWVPVW